MEQKSWGGRILPTVRGKSSNDVANVVALLCWSVAKSCSTLCDPMDCSTPVLPCLSLSPRVFSNSCPFSQWCYLTISSSATFFSFYLQSFPASGYFPVSQLFASGGQSIGASASASLLPVNSGLISGLISSRIDQLDLLAVQRTLKSLLQHHISYSMFNLLYGPTLGLGNWSGGEGLKMSAKLSLVSRQRTVMLFWERMKSEVEHKGKKYLDLFSLTRLSDWTDLNWASQDNFFPYAQLLISFSQNGITIFVTGLLRAEIKTPEKIFQNVQFSTEINSSWQLSRKVRVRDDSLTFALGREMLIETLLKSR